MRCAQKRKSPTESMELAPAGAALEKTARRTKNSGVRKRIQGANAGRACSTEDDACSINDTEALHWHWVKRNY